MAARPADAVFVLDSSLSMGRQYSDFRPNKLKASAEIAARAARLAIEKRGDRIGVIVFNAYVIPLLHPTSDFEAIVRTLAAVGHVGEGSALGDAIIEAVKMLRGTMHRDKLVIAITDGELNVGAPLSLATLYAANSGVRPCIVVIGRRGRISVERDLEALEARGLLSWNVAETVQRAEAVTLSCLERQKK